MLKRWFSVKKKSKEETDSSQQSGLKSNADVSTNQSQTPYHTPRMSPESKPIPKPTPIRTKDRSVRTTSGHSNQLQSPASEKLPVGDNHSGNDTLPSLMSTSIETVMDMDPPILFTASTENMPFGDGSNKVFGFENFGNTCYCNSVLQCLYNMTEFRVQMLQYPKRTPSTRRRRKADMPGKKPRFFNEASFDHRPIHNNNSNNNNNGANNNTANAKRDNESSNNGHSNSVTSENSQTTNVSNSKSVESSNNQETSNNNNSGSNDHDDTNPDAVNSKSKSIQNSNKPSVEPDGLSSSSGDQSSAKLSRPNGVTSSSSKDSSASTAVNSGSQPVHSALDSSNPFDEKIHENTQKIIVGRNSNTSSQGPVELHPAAATNHKTGGSDAEKGTAVENNDLSSSTAHSGKLTSQKPQSQQSQHSQQQHSSHSNLLSTEQRKKSALIKGPVLNVDHLLHESGEANLYTGLKDIFECITENIALTGVLSPVKFVDILKKENVLFNTTMHQDAHEFLNFLLNGLGDYLNTIKSGEGDEEDSLNFIKDLFQGTLTNSVKCFTCDNVTSRDEPFLDFPIEVSDDSETDVQALLQNFDQREMLSGSNKFYCNECCGLQEAERSVGLKKLPHTLALHLKRFKYSETKNCNIKLFNKVHYPLTLDVCSTDPDSVCKKYELSGIVVHMGGGPQHGHYVSLCKNDNFGWLLFDDETVESVSENTVQNFVGDASTLTTAYVLFYRELPSDLDDSSARSYDKKRYEENIERLLKYDEWLRATSSKTTSMSETNPVIEATTKEPPMAPPSVPNIERETSTTSVKSTRPKSRLFNFMKS